MSASNGQAVQKGTVPLPATTSDMLAQRHIKAGPTLNDYVETIHIRMYSDLDYQRYLEAVWPSDTVEGSVGADNLMAAQMIRNAAKDGNDAASTVVAGKNLATIVKALGVVLRRYDMSREQRQLLLGGETVRYIYGGSLWWLVSAELNGLGGAQAPSAYILGIGPLFKVKYALHPACAAWPQMADDALADLTADIEANGLRDPITLTPDGELLDGRNRAIACERLGIDPLTVVYDGDPVAFSISRNKNRRHLDKVDIAFACAAMVDLPRGAPFGSANAAKLKVVNTTFNSKGRSAAEIADQASIHRDTVFDAKAVVEKGTAEVLDLVQRLKKVGLRAAANYVRKTPKDEQVADPKIIRGMPEVNGKRGKIPSPQRDKAREIVRPLVESGQPTNPEKLRAEHGLSEISFREASALERGRLEGLQEAADAAPIDTSTLSQTAQEKFAALERRLRAQLEAEISRRVTEGISKHIDNFLMPHYREKLADADRVLAWNRGKLPFSNQEYRLLMAVLHPDSTDQSLRTKVFNWVVEREIILRKVEKDEKKLSSGLPVNLAELMARRERVRQERAAAVKSRSVSRK